MWRYLKVDVYFNMDDFSIDRSYSSENGTSCFKMSIASITTSSYTDWKYSVFESSIDAYFWLVHNHRSLQWEYSKNYDQQMTWKICSFWNWYGNKEDVIWYLKVRVCFNRVFFIPYPIVRRQIVYLRERNLLYQDVNYFSYDVSLCSFEMLSLWVVDRRIILLHTHSSSSLRRPSSLFSWKPTVILIAVSSTYSFDSSFTQRSLYMCECNLSSYL